MKTLVTLIVGIVIGAGAMWYMQKSSEKTLQVDEVIESYSAPMESQPAPAPAPANMDHMNSDAQGQATQGSH